jgi:hypothetical protein
MRSWVKSALVLILVVAAAIQIQQRLGEPAAISPAFAGGQVPMVPLLPLANAAEPITSSAAADIDCTFFYFWDPACPACEIGAPDWAGVEYVGADRTPVVWILTAEPDSAARSFIVRHGISAPNYFVEDSEDRRGLGVVATPSAWAVHGGVIRAILPGRFATSPTALSSELCNLPSSGALHE